MCVLLEKLGTGIHKSVVTLFLPSVLAFWGSIPICFFNTLPSVKIRRGCNVV